MALSDPPQWTGPWQRKNVNGADIQCYEFDNCVRVRIVIGSGELWLEDGAITDLIEVLCEAVKKGSH